MDRLRSECLTCILDKHLKAYPEGTAEAEKIAYMQGLLRILGNARTADSAPVLMEDVEDLQQRMFPAENRYRAIKQHFNGVMLGYEDEVRRELAESDDPLRRAIHYALTANYIDFGAMQHVDEKKLRELLKKDTPVDEKNLFALRRDLETKKRLLVLTDNCGEIVMDKLLMETVKSLYPHLEITAMVRGGEVLNDATLEDAEQVGLTNIVRVIPNGTRIAGTCVERLTGEALAAWKEADVVIAKGQGNFETLRMCGKNVYYLFLCKCQMFADVFSVPRLTGMLVRDEALKRE